MSVPIDEAWAVLKQEAQPPGPMKFGPGESMSGQDFADRVHALQGFTATPMQPPGQQQPTAYEQTWGRPEPQWMKDLREKQALSAFRSAVRSGMARATTQPVQPAAEKKVGVMGKIKGGVKNAQDWWNTFKNEGKQGLERRRMGGNE